MKNKKDLLGGVIIIVMLILVLVTYLSFYNYEKDNKEEEIMTDTSLKAISIYDDYRALKIEDNTLIDKVVISSYDCKKDDCEVYSNSSFESIYDEKFILIKENNKVFVYDFIANEVISDDYDDIINVFNDYFIVKNNNKLGLISKSGISIIKPVYDKLELDSIYDSYLKVKNNNLYGVVDLDNGELLIDTKYKDINITDAKYYSVLKDKLWYVIDKEDNILTKGYEYVYPFSKGYIAKIDNNLQCLKYNNEELNSTIIPVDGEFNIVKNNNIINIEVNNELKYEYNISRNSLINK